MVDSQELYIEMMCNEAEAYDVLEELTDAKGAEKIGYLLVSSDKTTIVEFYCTEECDTVAILRSFIEQHPEITTILTMSTTQQLMNSCLDMGLKYEVVGANFRDWQDTQESLSLQSRKALESDYNYLKENNEEVFDYDEQINEWISNGWVYIAENEGQSVGFGLCTPTLKQEYNETADIGILVASEHRHQGPTTRSPTNCWVCY
ncbi:hypothetical protein PCE1_002116 [Barthelona sp. PCE]